MGRWIRFAAITVAVPILLLAGLGIYSLARSSPGSAAHTPGIPLVKPALAQSGTSFPDPDAGLSAYVDLNPASVDFTNVVDNVFTQVFYAGDNFVVGNVVVSTIITNAGHLNVNVRVYVDTDGLIIGYFPDATINGLMFDWDGWNSSNPVINTTFEEAIETVAQAAMGQTIAGQQLSWYDWAHPSATHLLAVAKSINEHSENLFLSIPSSGIVILGTPSYSFKWNLRTNVGDNDLIVERSDGLIVVNSTAHIGDLQLDPNFMYTLSATRCHSFCRVGVSIVYQIP